MEHMVLIMCLIWNTLGVKINFVFWLELKLQSLINRLKVIILSNYP